MVERDAGSLGNGGLRFRSTDAYGLLPPGDHGTYSLLPAYMEPAARDVALRLSRAGVWLALILMRNHTGVTNAEPRPTRTIELLAQRAGRVIQFNAASKSAGAPEEVRLGSKRRDGAALDQFSM